MNSFEHKLYVQHEFNKEDKSKPKRVEFINLGQMQNRVSENSAGYKTVVQLVDKYVLSGKHGQGIIEHSE